MAKETSAKLKARHYIGYGAGDAGGVVTMVMIGNMARYVQNILGVDPKLYAAMLLHLCSSFFNT